MQQLIKRVEQSNQQIAHHCEVARWDDLLIESQKRQQLIEQFFENNISAIQSEELEKLQAIIQKSDSDISSKMKRFRVDAIDSGVNLKKAQSALQKYTTTRNTPHTE